MDNEIRTTCNILESIAKRYPQGSAEDLAIREAADAFIYLRQHEGLKKSYEAFLRSCKKPLPKDAKQTLKKAGINP